MINRIRGPAEEAFGDGEVPYGDFVVVSGAFGCAYVTPATARAIERATPHLTANGRQLVVKVPPHTGDWNDLLREIRSL